MPDDQNQGQQAPASDMPAGGPAPMSGGDEPAAPTPPAPPAGPMMPEHETPEMPGQPASGGMEEPSHEHGGGDAGTPQAA